MAPRAAAAGGALPRRRAAALLVPGAGAGWGFVGLFALLLGAALARPPPPSSSCARPQAPAGRAFGLLGRMAARGIVASLSRTGVAIAALMIAISATIGIGIMIASFREAVVDWLAWSLQADVYIAPPSLIGSRPDATLDPALVQTARRDAGRRRCQHVPRQRRPRPGRPCADRGARARGWAARPDSSSARAEPRRRVAGVRRRRRVVSEPFAYRHAIGAGGSVRLRTDRGERDFPVAGVFYDYGSSAGTVVMSRPTYDRFWNDRAISALALYAAPAVDVDRADGRAPRTRRRRRRT